MNSCKLRDGQELQVRDAKENKWSVVEIGSKYVTCETCSAEDRSKARAAEVRSLECMYSPGSHYERRDAEGDEEEGGEAYRRGARTPAK